MPTLSARLGWVIPVLAMVMLLGVVALVATTAAPTQAQEQSESSNEPRSGHPPEDDPDDPDRDTPTPEPTEAPTEEPTAEPTEEPTAEPTEEPTAEPTEEPTAEPTEEPTAEPTSEPPTPKPLPFVAQPQNLVTSNVTTNSINLSWDAVDGAAKYRARRTVDTSPKDLAEGAHAAASAATSHNFTGMLSNTCYWLSVQGYGNGTTHREAWGGQATTRACTENSPPTVTIHTAAQTVSGGDTVSLDATAADPAGHPVTYSWLANGGTFADSTVLDATWTAPAAQATRQSYTLTITVSDGELTASASVTMTVRALTIPTPVPPPTPPKPVVSIVRATSETGSIGESESATFTVTLDRAPGGQNLLTVKLELTSSGSFLKARAAEVSFFGSEKAKSYVFSPHDDDTDEQDADVTVAIKANDAYTIKSDKAAAVVRVTDDDIPAKPTNFQVHGHMTGGAVTLRWDRDSTVTRFDVQYIKELCVNEGNCGVDPDDEWRAVPNITTTRTDTTEPREAEFSGKAGFKLEGGGFYRIRIQSRNIDSSPWSDDVVFHTSLTPPDYIRDEITGDPLPARWTKVGPGDDDYAWVIPQDEFGTMRPLTFQRNGAFTYRICDPSVAPANDSLPSKIPTPFAASDVSGALMKWENAVVWKKANGKNIIGTNLNSETDCTITAVTYNQVGFYTPNMLGKYCGATNAQDGGNTLGCLTVKESNMASLVTPLRTPHGILLNAEHAWTDTAGGCTDLVRITVHEAGHAFGFGHARTNDSIMGGSLDQIAGQCDPTLWDVALMMRLYQSR